MDTITFPAADVLLHVEVKAAASSVGSCCKEFEDILLLHLQDIKGCRLRESFPLGYDKNPEQCHMDPLWVVCSNTPKV